MVHAALPALLFSLLPIHAVRVLYLRRKHRFRRISGACWTCGYNLTANTSGVCPECGTAIERRLEPAA